MERQKIAILYQAKPSPVLGGVQKPMKLGGYSDSGADIAYELHKSGKEIIVPSDNPNINNDFDWVFPDTKEGIQKAIEKGANLLWLNTVLYKNHVIEKFFNDDIRLVGQLPNIVDIHDDKFFTNELLRKNHIPIPKAELINIKELESYSTNIDVPVVVKPIRGRGSQGVTLAPSKKALDVQLESIFASKKYGEAIYIEQFLEGQEITVTVMPAGKYTINHTIKIFEKPWPLPAVKRFNHHNGIAPYSGLVAVTENSQVLDERELNSPSILEVYKHCIKAAGLVNIKAPIRIDCRADNNGKYFLFDVNMKPNMTGPSRTHRQNQDSLSLLSARKIGWDYQSLLENILRQSWKPGNHLDRK